MNFFYKKLSVCTFIITIGIIVNSAQAEEKALWATSRYVADIKFIVVDDRKSPKWYIGECSGDITMRSDRIKLYKSDRKGAGIYEVQLVADKYYADRVFCIK